MTTLAAPNLMDLLKICSRPRTEEIDQYRAITGREWVIDEVVQDLHNRQGLKFVVLDDDREPVVVFGVDLVVPGVWQTWMVGTLEGWNKHGFGITRHCKRVMDKMIGECGARRIQTMALVSRTKACRWFAKGLGMVHESTATAFGVGGEDFACYVRLK